MSSTKTIGRFFDLTVEMSKSSIFQSSDEIIFTLPRWFFRQCRHSRNLRTLSWKIVYSKTPKIQSKISDLTINVDHLESVEVSRQRQSFIFSNSEKSQPRWFSNNKMASSQNLVRNTSPVYCSWGQKSSKSRWWMASWDVHRGLGLPIHGFSRQNPALSYIFLKTPF